MPRDNGDDDDDRDRDKEEDEAERESFKKRKRRRPTNEDKQMAMFCHLGGLLGIILPLILWITQKEKSSFIDEHGKEAVNFGITMMIAHLVIGLVTCGFGILITAPVSIIFHVMAGMAANRGEDYEYPICIRFIK
jgi:uncharacterized Tic20 family protein